MTRRRAGLAAAWLAALAGQGLMAAWMLGQPVALPSDDALFFAHGLVRFSVLEFSPHFPGYPGFVLLGRLCRLLAATPERALFLASISSALGIPAAAGWAAWRWTRDGWAAFLAFAGALAQPLLPALGLSLLSDASGLLCMLLGLGTLAAPSWGPAGFLFGLAVCCRPSDAPFALAALIGAGLGDRRRAPALLAGFLLPCILAFGAVLAWEGWSYVEEGWRFVAGHTTLWGNTAFAGSGDGGAAGWLQVVRSRPWLMLPLLPALAVPVSGRGPACLAAGITLAAALSWTVLLQNPDHLRHAAPALLVAGLLAAARPGRPCWRHAAGAVILLANLAVLHGATDWHWRPPPLEAAERWLRQAAPGTVITNQGVALLRRDLARQRVVDAYYAGDAAFAAATATGPVYRLAAIRPALPGPAIAFAGRFAGEPTLWLQAGRPSSAR